VGEDIKKNAKGRVKSVSRWGPVTKSARGKTLGCRRFFQEGGIAPIVIRTRRPERRYPVLRRSKKQKTEEEKRESRGKKKEKAAGAEKGKEKSRIATSVQKAAWGQRIKVKS